MSAIRSTFVCAFALALLLQFGCSRSTPVQAAGFNMGDRVQVGPLVYHVTEADWKTELGEFPAVRMPERKFLLIHLTVTNSGGETFTIPQGELQNSRSESFQELTDGTGVPEWLGLLRSVKPAATEQGVMVFDVPANAYRLRLTDGGDPEHARVSYVEIPLTFEQ
jgi:Domain of unknown function (DUF4352)